MYTGEHHKAMNFSYNLESLIHSFYNLKDTDDKLTVTELISESFNEFVILSFNHMDDEEAVLNEILWRYHSDTFIRQIENEMSVLQDSVKQPQKTEGLQIATAA